MKNFLFNSLVLSIVICNYSYSQKDHSEKGQLPQFVTIMTKTNPSIAGGLDGSIELTTSGGYPPYTYTWSNGASTNVINGLAAGSYEITIVDSALFTVTDIIVLVDPPQIAFDLENNNPTFVSTQNPSIGNKESAINSMGTFNHTPHSNFPNDKVNYLFPNPSTGSFYLKNEDAISAIEIYNMNGLKLNNLQAAELEFTPTITLEPGTYSVLVYLKDNSRVKQIIVVR